MNNCHQCGKVARCLNCKVPLNITELQEQCIADDCEAPHVVAGVFCDDHIRAHMKYVDSLTAADNEAYRKRRSEERDEARDAKRQRDKEYSARYYEAHRDEILDKRRGN